MLIAVDTNVLLDLAEAEESVIDALETIRARVNCRFVASPTVLHELASQYEEGEAAESRAAAKALESLLVGPLLQSALFQQSTES